MDISNNKTKKNVPVYAVASCSALKTVGCIHPLNDPNYTLYKSLDEKNHIVMKIMKERGPDAAAKHMMEMAGGDYATMRMIYG